MQVAAGQRGPAESDLLSEIDFSKAWTLHIPDVMTEIITAHNRGETERPFSGVIADECFTESPEQCLVARNAHSTDVAFIISQSCHNRMPSWTLYNQKANTVNPKKTMVVYLPIIQAPASDLDNLSKEYSMLLNRQINST